MRLFDLVKCVFPPCRIASPPDTFPQTSGGYAMHLDGKRWLPTPPLADLNDNVFPELLPEFFR